jgi:hypothetical protein
MAVIVAIPFSRKNANSWKRNALLPQRRRERRERESIPARARGGKLTCDGDLAVRVMVC